MKERKLIYPIQRMNHPQFQEIKTEHQWNNLKVRKPSWSFALTEIKESNNFITSMN